MNNLNLAFSVVFPLFVTMSLGYFLKYIKMLSESFTKQLNGLCFKVFLPCLIFVNIYSSEFSKAFDLKLIVFACFCIFSSFFVLMLLVKNIKTDNNRKGVIVQGIFRSNYVLYGMAVASSLSSVSELGTTSVLISFAIPLYNVFSVIALESFKQKNINYRVIIKGILKNPLIIATFCALFFLLTGLKLPFLIEKVVIDISKIATPLAFIVLGASFKFSKLGKNVKALTAVVLGKLVLMPFVFLPLAVYLGFRDGQLVAIMTMLASPTAVSSFTMAEDMGLDGELAGQIVVLTSSISIVTMFFWIFVLKQLSLF